jgi:hypothetical protein
MKLTARGKRKLAETSRGIAGVCLIVLAVMAVIAVPLPILALWGGVTFISVVIAIRLTVEVFRHKVTTRYKRRRWIRFN